MDIENAQLVSTTFMCILLAWSVVWIVLGVINLNKSSEKPYFWKTHALWCLVNAVIAIVALAGIFGRETFDIEYVTSQKNIVLINIGLDVVYAIIAGILLRSKKSKYVQVGSALLIQAVFLFVLDSCIVLVLNQLIR